MADNEVIANTETNDAAPGILPVAPVATPEAEVAAPVATEAPVEKEAEVAPAVTADPFAAVEGQEGDQGNVSATAPEDATLTRHSKRSAS